MSRLAAWFNAPGGRRRYIAIVLWLIAGIIFWINYSIRKEQAANSLSALEWRGQSEIELPLVRGSRYLVVATEVMGPSAMAALDSGSSGAAMTQALAVAAGAGRKGSQRVNNDQYESARDVRVQLGPAYLEIAKVPVADLPSDQPLLLGSALFSKAVVDVDIDAGVVRLIRPDAFVVPAAEPLPLIAWKFVPTVELKLNRLERPVCAILDTGYSGGISLASTVVNELGLPVQAEEPEVFVGVGGVRHAARRLVPLEMLQIGELSYEGVEAHQMDRHLKREPCANLLGMGVLRQHRIVFDMPGGRIWILPRSAAGN
jgi:hypothetical protein